jgi:hypothetical protein
MYQSMHFTGSYCPRVSRGIPSLTSLLDAALDDRHPMP